ncbi:hypothetical protein ASC67_05095 [Methylibium sp. Root1272]|nr:hypothetical protein ASC67_05095 [Methylibium sp. Root1272]
MGTETSCGATAQHAGRKPMACRQRRTAELDASEIAPLGPKAALLHERRQRRALSKPTPRDSSRSVDAVRLASDDGAVAFALHAVPEGLFVERTQRRPLGALVTVAMVFERRDAFARWCDSDPVRFDHPMLHSHLRRHGDELLPERA